MADAMMMFLGEAHGVNWYWAQPGEFENPGAYYWDGAKNVLCVPHISAPDAPQPANQPLTDKEIGQVRWQCRWNRMSTDDNLVSATTQQLDAFANAIIAAYERKNGVQT